MNLGLMRSRAALARRDWPTEMQAEIKTRVISCGAAAAAARPFPQHDPKSFWAVLVQQARVTLHVQKVVFFFLRKLATHYIWCTVK